MPQIEERENPDPATDIRLSVVVVGWNGLPLLRRCLKSLGPVGPDIEIIVVSAAGAELQHVLAHDFPNVTHVVAPPGTTVPFLRSLGLTHARGEIVALAEDHCLFHPRWSFELQKAHESGYPIIGGAVENCETQSALDWAVYFYDYGRFMLPCAGGAVDSLPGNNVSFKRGLLSELAEQLREGYWEPVIHGEIIRRGKTLYLAPSVVVYHAKNYRFKEAISLAYHLGRTFAVKRSQSNKGDKRVVFVAGSLGLPILLSARIVLRVLRRRSHVKQMFLALPYIVLLTASWSMGEFFGYLLGAGTSLDHWR